MDTQPYSSTLDSSVPSPNSNSLASSILQNIFGRNGLAQADDRSESPVFSNTPDISEESAPSERAYESTPPIQNSLPANLVRDVLSQLDERKEKAAIELGIGVSEVESLPFDLSTLESEGIFMNIDCRGFGTLVRQLEWKTLGVRLLQEPDCFPIYIETS